MTGFLIAAGCAAVLLLVVVRCGPGTGRLVSLFLLAVALAVAGWFLLGDLHAQKLVARLLMPIGLIWILLIGLAKWLWWRRAWGPALLATLAVFAYAAAGSQIVGAWLQRGLEERVPGDPGGAFDAVCVLGGGTELTIDGRPQLGTGGDRIAEAARLWHAGRARLLVASGSSIPDLGTPRDLTEETATLWTGLGVPREAIVRLRDAVNTSQEIAQYAKLMRERGWKRVAVVSSGWHLPRAMASARREGVALIPLASDCRGRHPGWSPVFFVPYGEGFDDVGHACWEHLGILIGR